MKQQKTYYHILEIGPDVSQAEIKRSYRKLVKNYHPDIGHSEGSLEEQYRATEYMMSLNEAYETLMDKTKRAAYDRKIGIARQKIVLRRATDSYDEEIEREKYLRLVFHPSRHSIERLLKMYPAQLRKLSLDIYDDDLLAQFGQYVDLVEDALYQSSHNLSQSHCPPSLDAAVRSLRNSIARAADGLEELQHFCRNFDYDQLSMAGNLFRIALDLSRDSLRATRG